MRRSCIVAAWLLLYPPFSEAVPAVPVACVKLTNPKNFKLGAVVLGQTSLAEATRALGAVHVQQSGGEGTFQRSACYGDGKGGFLILQTTDPAVQAVSVYHFTRGPNREESCRESRSLRDLPRTESGLGLSLTRKDLLARLGVPARVDGDRLSWLCSYSTKSGTRTLSADVRIAGDKIIDLEIGSVVSNDND